MTQFEGDTMQLSRLASWYHHEYTGFKGLPEGTDWVMANNLATTVLTEDCVTKLDGEVGNLRGILGEILTRAAMGTISPKCYRHQSTHQYLEPLGMDIRVMNGDPRHPIAGLGVKLRKGLPPSVQELPFVHKCVPVVGLKVKPAYIGLDGLIQRQKEGSFIDPRTYIQNVFQDSSVYFSFREALGHKCVEALEMGIGQAFPKAGHYLENFAKF